MSKRLSLSNDFFNTIKNHPFADGINRQIWHTSYGRTGIFVIEYTMEQMITTVTFALGLSCWHYVSIEMKKLGLESYGNLLQVLFWFSIGVGLQIMKQSTTPAINRNMGGDYHDILEHHKKMVKEHRALISEQREHINEQRLLTKEQRKNLHSKIVLARTVNPRIGIKDPD